MSTTEELTKTEILKQYLLEKDNAYLLDDNNNGKTVMLSGAWGSGKTHFWQHEIEPELKNKLKDKACVYVSLYGKESLSDIKSDVYLSANGKNILSTEVSTFGIEALSAIKDSDLAIGKAAKAGKALLDNKKMQKGIAKLKKGGIICFDDFERKSKNVDLNDLFGFISQLAINLECKVVIILNSDVFKDKEAEIFSRVKEKTISKFFYFEPSFKELFHLIANNPKYDALDDYKDNILSVIKETQELNARIYIQVLDNCLEWLKVKKDIDNKIIRTLTLATFNFILNNFTINFNRDENIKKIFNSLDYLHLFFDASLYSETEEEFLYALRNLITSTKTSEIFKKNFLQTIVNSELKLKALFKYGEKLNIRSINGITYIEINKYIVSGILLP